MTVDLPDAKYFRLIADTNDPRDESALSLKLKGITGFHSDDYVPPVIREAGELITLISDESHIKGHVAVSLVALPVLGSEKLCKYEDALADLVARFGIPHIHFSEIFGRKNVAGRNPTRFLDAYAQIVSSIPMSCLSLSKSRAELIRSFQEDGYSNEELFHSLFWNHVDRFAAKMVPHSVLHINREVDNNFTKDECIQEFHKLLGGVAQIESLRRHRHSVCRHPHFFTKKALLYSSVADLAAYGSNLIQYKLDTGVAAKKVARRYKPLLVVLKRVFTNYTGLASAELVALVRAS